MSFHAGATIAEILRSQTDGLHPLERRILLSHVTGLSRIQLITRAEHALSAEESERLHALCTRRLAGEPIAYLTGEREFFGLSFRVDPAVLIPRPETELLVERAQQVLPQHGRLLDMGTGSGAIAVALAHSRPDADITALDVSAEALLVAKENADRLGVRVHLMQSDWFSALDATVRFDVIVSNPPYIVAGDTHLSQGDLRFEPIDALTDHADGLSALRTLCRHAPDHLEAAGWLLMEHGYDQAAAVRDLLEETGFGEVQSWRDLAAIERVSGGRLAR